MRSALLILTVAACSGPAPKPPEAPLDNATGDDTISVTRTRCPGDAALLELAPRVWTRSTSFEELWCVAARVEGEPRWYVSGYASEEDGEATQHIALVTPDGRAVWSWVRDIDVYLRPHGDAMARDLDGDGTDEVLFGETIDEGTEAWSAVIVVPLDRGEMWTELAKLGDAGCEADWTLDDRTIVITGEGACAKYSGRYRWDGMELLEH